MKNKFVAVLGAAAIALSLSACDTGSKGEPIGGNVIAPVTQSIEDLDGSTVALKVGQVLNINTGDIEDPTKIDGVPADASIVSFTPARKTDTAEFNPGFKALKEGSTEVSLTEGDAGVAPIQFTIEVTK